MFLTKYINRKFNYVVNRHNSALQTNFSYLQISKIFNEELFIPMTSWSISPNLILHILNDIKINDKKCIVEFGAGVSTLYIAKLIKINKMNTVFYSIESDVTWSQKIAQQLKLLGLDDVVKIILAPIEKISNNLTYNNQDKWYDQESLKVALKTVENIDLVLIDGPSGMLCEYSRFSAVPFLKEKLAQDYTTFLDDANRKDEKEIATAWRKDLDCKLRFEDNYAVLSTPTAFGVLPFKL